jgi:hypothetical protein
LSPRLSPSLHVTTHGSLLCRRFLICTVTWSTLVLPQGFSYYVGIEARNRKDKRPGVLLGTGFYLECAEPLSSSESFQGTFSFFLFFGGT